MTDNEEGILLEKPNERTTTVPNRRAMFQSSTLAQTLLWVLHSIRPSFLSTAPRSSRLRKTAYLDGIRGFAAFLVYWHHHILWSHEAKFGEMVLQSSWGWKHQHLLVTLPFVRNFFTGGHLAVAIFFVLSGYVLSTKPLSLMDQGEYLALADNMTSSMFRRWFRLWIPVIVVSFGVVTLYYTTGVFSGFVPEGSYTADVVKWYKEIKNYTFIFGHPKIPWLSYHPHSWTIRNEMCGSLIVYCAIIALSRASRKARLWCEAGLVFYFMYIVDGAHYSMFMAGMFLCDVDLHLNPSDLPNWITNLQPFESTIWYSMLVVGFYLGGVPSAANDIPYLQDSIGWYYLSFLKPSAVYDFKWFYLFWAAVFIISAVPRIGWLKRFFETRFCLYLGRISYMLYLFHGPVLWTLGDRLYAAAGWSREGHAMHLMGWTNRFPLPKWGPAGLEVAFLVPNIILLPFTLWMAEIGTSLIDGPAIKFGSWFFAKTRPTAEHLNGVALGGRTG